ncbi:MAG: hypothetical protein HY064_00950 [Bacteroidetes bacterium]|nr:hypothetical protein [Bacteroidota bacterium]
MRRALPFFLLCLFFATCKRDTDTAPPDISVVTPYDMQQFNVFDTIHVHFTAHDETQLTNYNVKLEDANNISVIPGVSGTLTGMSADISFDYPISEIRLTSGTYYLVIEVSDGTNLKRIFRNIYVTEVPRKLKGACVVISPSANYFEVNSIDTAMINVANISGFYYGFTDMFVNSYWQQAVVEGNDLGYVNGYSLGTINAFNYYSSGAASPVWGGICSTGQRYWVTMPGSGMIRSFDETGLTKAQGATDAGYYALKIFNVGSRVFTEQRNVTTFDSKIVVYNTSGVGLQESPMNLDVVSFFEKDADNIYTLGNWAGQGHLFIYDYNSNGFWEPVSLAAGATITCAAQIDNTTLLIAMSNSVVYKFTYSPVGLLTWKAGVYPSLVEYDQPDDAVFWTEGSALKKYSFSTAALLRTYTSSSNILDLSLWYNR